ncbi:acyltransferase family protein [Mycolicibacterium sp. CH28]|uniref:acyltransferase family protein n=1 Tax=Mycolicibacterium sp. CH28 TaxID=2512237 RepID=UPI001F2821F0|nr:acyltransferase family protein [Mycolicibacterium sp. CH28]
MIGTRAADEIQNQREQQKTFRPDIEGLRAVAVVSVVLFHAAAPGVSGGYVGVDVFFVISGFLITGLLWREVGKTGTVRLRSFYGARARRLLPASAAVGAITMIVSVLLLPPLRVSATLYDGIASALYVSNYWFVFQGGSYFAAHVSPSPFLHYWSLGVEEQFYLVWAPLILGTAWLIRRVRRRNKAEATSSLRPYLVVLTLVTFVSFALSLAITYGAPAIAFYSLPTRAWQLGLGGLVALTAGHWRRLRRQVAAVTGWAGLVSIMLACTWFSPTTLFPGVAALLPTLGAVLVIGAGCAAPAQGCGHFLGWSPMQAIGRISYSWYLWHWPVLVFAPLLVGHSLGLSGRLAAAVLAAGLAWLTLRYLENPLRFSPMIRDSPWRSLTLGGVATAVAVCAGLALLNVVPTPVGRGAPAAPPHFTATAPLPAGSPMAAYDAAVGQAFAEVQAAVAASVDVAAVPSNLDPPLAGMVGEPRFPPDGCLRDPFQSGHPECAKGVITSSTTVALVGDSHAHMWAPAFEQTANERGWRVEVLAKAGCPLMDVYNHDSLFRRLNESSSHCEQWRADIITRLRAERPRLVVVDMWRGYGVDEYSPPAAGYTAYDSTWIESLTRLVQQLRAIGSSVVVLGPIPDPHTSMPVCLSGHLDDVTACSPPRSTAVDAAGIAAEAAATTAGGGQYVDITDLFCTPERCPVIVGNTLVYNDSDHLTDQYSRALAPAIAALTDRALAGG